MAAEAAIQERKKEVEAELGEQLKERSKEHEKHKYQEHEDSFKALLVDLVSPFWLECITISVTFNPHHSFKFPFELLVFIFRIFNLNFKRNFKKMFV